MATARCGLPETVDNVHTHPAHTKEGEVLHSGLPMRASPAL
jgi:hypothetical protein